MSLTQSATGHCQMRTEWFWVGQLRDETVVSPREMGIQCEGKSLFFLTMRLAKNPPSGFLCHVYGWSRGVDRRVCPDWTVALLLIYGESCALDRLILKFESCWPQMVNGFEIQPNVLTCLLSLSMTWSTPEPR